MTEVFLVVFDKVHDHPVQSAHETEALARRAVKAVIDDMPEDEVFIKKPVWTEHKTRKRVGPHRGDFVASWSCRAYGECTTQIAEIYILRLEVGNAIERLAELVREEDEE